jgi:hypothetical protein
LSGFSIADWNTFVRDNLEAVVERPTVGLSDSRTASADYVLASGTVYAVHWYDEDWDSHGLHSTASNRSRITAPAGWAGVYLIVASITVAGGDPDGFRRASIRKNGSVYYGESEQTPASGKGRTTMHVASFVDLDVGDYVEIMAFQNSGTTLQLLGNLDDDELGCTCQAIYWADTAASSDALTLEGYTGGGVDSWWNTEVVGSFRRLRSRPVARLSSTTTTIAADTWTTLSAPAETFDNAAIHSTSTNTSRLTAPIDGMYLIFGQGAWSSGATGAADIRIRLNGSSTGIRSQSAPIVGSALSLQVAAFLHLTAGEYVEIEIRHRHTSSLAVSTWLSMGWCGQLFPVSDAQRLTEDWSDDPYVGGAQTSIVPRPWLDIHTRDLPGVAQCPPAVQTQARFTRDITPGEWKKVKFNRQAIDTWNTVKGVRNFGEKYVIPLDGVWLFGAQVNVKDDSVIEAKFTVGTRTFTANAGTDVCTTPSTHNYQTGASVHLGTTGTLPGGLDEDQLFLRRLSTTTFSLHGFKRHAERGTNTIDITSAGTGTHRVSTSHIECRELNLRTGVRVQVSTSGTLPAGLAAGTDYWVRRVGKDKMRLCTSEENAASNVYVPIVDSGAGDHRITVMEPYGARGCRLVQAGEVQGGWLGQPAPSFETSRPVLSVIAAKAGDELWCEAITTGPEGSRITAQTPSSRMWACWLGPFGYTGALPMADRPLT